jgi:hypothetical protein
MGAEAHVGLCVKCPLFLSNSNQNWNMLTNLSRTASYKISRQLTQWFSSYYMRTDGPRGIHGELNRHVFKISLRTEEKDLY